MTLQVNGRVIPDKAVLVELKRLMEFYGQHMPREELGRHSVELLERAREHAIGTQLLLEEVMNRNVEVSEAEVAAGLSEMIKRVGGEEKLAEMLARQGLTLKQFTSSIRVGKQLDAFVARITSTAPECTEEELLKYFEDHPERYVSLEQVLVRHILMRPASESEADKAVTLSILMGLKKKILEGDDFAELASIHSECPSGKESGGSLGWIARGAAVPEFDQVVFDELEVGEVSDAIQTPLGFHLVELIEKEMGEPLLFKDVKQGILELLTHERKGKALSDFVAKLRAKAVVEDSGATNEKEWESVFDSFLDGQKPN
jgi:parvulin-like peptidyl-prolyl isomerase